MEYVDEVAQAQGKPHLLPDDLYARSVARFQADHVNRHIIPAFYRYLQAQEAEKQAAGCKEFLEGLVKLTEMFEKSEKECPEAVGLWRADGQLGEHPTTCFRAGLDSLTVSVILEYRLGGRDAVSVAVSGDQRAQALQRLRVAVRRTLPSLPESTSEASCSDPHVLG